MILLGINLISLKVKIFIKKIYFNFFNNKSWLLFIKTNIKSLQSIENKKPKKNVLFATSLGAERIVTKVEIAIGLAVKLRNINISYILCDSALKACQLSLYSNFKNNINEFKINGPVNSICSYCFNPAKKLIEKIAKCHKYSDYLYGNEDSFIKAQFDNLKTIDEIKKFKFRNISIGEHAISGVLRFYAISQIKLDNDTKDIIFNYFVSAFRTYFIFNEFFKKNKTHVVVLHHGIYVPQGVIVDVAKKYKVKVVVWNVAYKKNTLLFSHNETYHHSLMKEDVNLWKNKVFNSANKNELDQYLKSRWNGNEDWIKFNLENPDFDTTNAIKQLGLDTKKPIVLLLTNVLWDAQLHYPQNVFEDMLEWIFFTVEYFKKRPEIQLVIRIHPAELTGNIPSRQLVKDELYKKFNLNSEFINNIKIVAPDSTISTYSIASIANSAIIYGTKMGVELTSMGIPTIVCGEAWIRNKNLTVDVTSKKNYIEILDKLPFNKRNSQRSINLARKYAYHFFFQRMIPVNFLKHQRKFFSPILDIDINTLEDLKYGNDKGLDVICNGIINGKPFVFDRS